MKVISFSLWGAKQMYTVGAIKNADLAATLFPDWICVFYYYDSVPNDILVELKKRPNVILRHMCGAGTADDDCSRMLSRFLPADEDGVEYMMSRDCDSRLSERERLAVDAWMTRGDDLHVMRDHPYHGVPILGGMWGVKGGRLPGLAAAIAAFAPTKEKGQDQEFLKEWIWPRVETGELTCCIHDPFFKHCPFPPGARRGPENAGVWFVGQVFDENDATSRQDIEKVRRQPGV